MQIPIFSKGPWLSAAVTAALLFAHQAPSAAGGGPPEPRPTLWPT